MYHQAVAFGGRMTRAKHIMLAIAITSLFFFSSTYLIPPSKHPIPTLLHDAKLRYEATQSSRSRTLREATKRYEETHNRPPPKGYAQWFAYAQSIRACNVDTFVDMYKSMEMWWAVEPKEIRRRMDLLAELNALGRVRVRDGKIMRLAAMEAAGINPGMMHGARNALEEMLLVLEERYFIRLPDVDMMVNGIDEPRVVVPYEVRSVLEEAASRGEIVVGLSEETIEFHTVHDSDRRGWDLVRRACPPSSLARRTPLSSSPGVSPSVTLEYTKAFTTKLGSFLFSPELERDTWCSQPDLQNLHAAFRLPLSFQWTDQLAPVFGNSKVDGYNDILIPAWFYWYDGMVYHEHDDPQWSKKENKIFWRGANTGGYSIGLSWMGWIRSRLVSRLNRPSEWNHEEALILADANENIIRTILPTTPLNENLANVAFTSPDAHGEKESLEAQWTEPSFRFTDRVPFQANFGAKGIVDMDGTAYSGRFIALMRSRSAVFKSRLFKEALDDSLIPWFHYVPLSIRFKELYSLLAYFFSVRDVVGSLISTGTRIDSNTILQSTQGVPHDEDLKAIADQGREWGMKCARKEDHVLYAYLLALEWSRICSDDRQAQNFVMGA